MQTPNNNSNNSNNNFDTLNKLVEGTIYKIQKAKSKVPNVLSYEDARQLASTFWMLIDEITEYIYTCGEIYCEVELYSKCIYAKRISNEVGSEAARKRAADNDNLYINSKGELAKLHLYKDYLINIRENLYSGYYLQKSTFERLISDERSFPKDKMQ